MYYSDSAELTPAGENVGAYNPFLQSSTQNQSQAPGSGFGYPFFGDAFGSPSCYIDWVLQPSCGTAFHMLSSGVGVLHNGPQFAHDGRRWLEFRAFADGSLGIIKNHLRR